MAESNDLKQYINQNLGLVPVISTPAPADWDCYLWTVVSGQSTLGTGFFKQWGAGFTDLFGSQSKAHNQKLATGERLCINQMRLKALGMSCNCVIGVDIDYADMEGLIMVCGTGTAAILRNIDLYGADRKGKLNELQKAVKRYNQLTG